MQPKRLGRAVSTSASIALIALLLLTASLVGIVSRMQGAILPRQSPEITAGIKLLADVIYVSGTLVPNPIIPPIPPSVQAATLLRGEFGPPENNVVLVDYPASLGLVNILGCGLRCPSGDQSVAAGVADLDTKIKDARNADPDGTIYVLSLSQGSVVATYDINKLRDEGFDTSNIAFVLTGDPNRPNGGALARIPVKVTVPIFGLTVGQQDVATPSDGAQVTVVTNQFDWAADDPAYLFNVVAWANVVAGFFYKTHNYENTAMDDPTAIVTTSGNMTSIFIPNPDGNLPLTVPLKGIVPQEYITAVDPFLRAVIMTGYEPSDDPAKRVTLRLAPPVSEWPAMAESVKAGLDETVRRVRSLVLHDTSVDPSIHTIGSDNVSKSFVQYGARFPKPKTPTFTESVQWKPESLTQFQLPVNSPTDDKGRLLDVGTGEKPDGDVTRTKPASIGDWNKFTLRHITGNMSVSHQRKPGDALNSAFNRVQELPTSISKIVSGSVSRRGPNGSLSASSRATTSADTGALGTRPSSQFGTPPSGANPKVVSRPGS
jgi:PE-PPE domain